MSRGAHPWLAGLVAVCSVGCQLIAGLDSPLVGPDGGGETVDGTVPDGATGSSDVATDAPDARDGGAPQETSADAPNDASTDVATGTDAPGDAPSDGGSVDPNVRCMPDAAPSLQGSVDCTPGTQECCDNQATGDVLSCVPAGICNGSTLAEILCDKPSQCTQSHVCRLCLDNTQYLSGTSCNLSDILGDGCDASSAWTLCAPGGSCEAGTCHALQVTGYPQGWFWACQ
jgi:hypothetical protein